VSLSLDKSSWKRVTLGDVIRHVTDRVDAESSGLKRFLAGEHIPSGDLHIRTWGDIGRDPIGPMFYKRFKPGHVLYVSRRAYLRKVAVPEFEGICGEKTFVLETLDSSTLLQEFLPFVLAAERFHSYCIAMSRGSVNPYVNWTELRRYEFDLPPLDEQKRLADLLWAIERQRLAVPVLALAGVEAQMLAELVDAARGPSMLISEMGTLLMGRQRSPQHAVGDNMVPYLRVANIGDGELKLNDLKIMNFTPDEQDRYNVLPGDILVSEGQSRELVGQSAMITSRLEKMCFQNTLIRFRPRPEAVRPRYAQALFRACLRSGLFAGIATQTTSIAHLGVQRFARLSLPLPTLVDQDRILARFAMIDRARLAAAAELDSLMDLRSACLVEIFGYVS
jgi:type I restriction enzyme S subunit